MGFLSSADYDVIRDDPSEIVGFYSETRADFIDALGMSGLSDDAYAAAWCTVIAYDLVPYGPGPATRDLGEILNSDTIACAHYVSLAWQLMGLLGISTDNQVAIGWDDGAVGNHAEMFFSDGTSNLLLDPTIGLIVNDATLEGLLSGTKYTDYATFYSRDDITDFNATVIDAVTNGLYHIHDVIYDVPTLDNWLNHYGDYQGLTLDQADGSKVIVGSLYDDVLVGTAFDDFIYGGKGNDTIDAGAGNDTIEGGKGHNTIDGSDGLDTFVFSGTRSDYIVTGDANSVTVSGTDGTDVVLHGEYLKFSDQILPLTAHTVEQTVASGPVDTLFDAQWSRLQVVYSYADGGSFVYQYDALSQFAWKTVETAFNVGGGRPQIVYTNDDATKTVYQYDLADAFAWSQVQTSFNASGQRDKIIYSNDDHSSVVYQYDALSIYSWSSYARYFDDAGNKTKDVYDNDSGTHTLYQYDVAGHLTSTHQFGFDWALIA